MFRHFRRCKPAVRLAAAALAFGAALTACGESPTGSTASNPPVVITTPGPNPIAQQLVPAAGSIYLGVYVNPAGVQPVPVTLLSSFESSIGRRMGVALHYYGFYDSFPGPYEADDAANGRIPVDSWDCGISNAAVAAGRVDTAIRARADAIRAYGHPIFLRYMWEMNLPSTSTYRAECYDPSTDLSNGVFSPQEYIAAWQRIRAIFTQEGVTNVVWVWNPSGEKNPLPYYPGASEVDWVAFDRYDVGNVSMAELYQTPYSWLAPLGKPIMVGETGAMQPLQDTFFSSAAVILQVQFPMIKSLMYFDSATAAYNWVIDPASMPAFTTMANDPYFSATEP